MIHPYAHLILSKNLATQVTYVLGTVTAGVYNPPNEADEYTQLFLKCSQHPNHVPKGIISKEFTTNNYVDCWKCGVKKRQGVSAVGTLDIIN